jgi:hypothetical protein
VTKNSFSFFRIAILGIFFLFFINFIWANKITKGFEALQEFNYFEAKKLFSKSLKKYPAPASFGLATIYYRKDNPFHSLDSAYKYIGIAKKNMANLNLKTKVKLEKYNYSDEAILELDQQISKAFFLICSNEASVSCFNDFIKNHPYSLLLTKAINKRDSLDFIETKKINSSKSTQNFLTKYPESYLKDEALNLFFKQQYFEYTQKETLIGYMLFLSECKDNPYRSEAENKIYLLSTSTNTLKSYENFINDHPTNRNIPDAWRKLYKIYMSDSYNSTKFEAFIKKYPNYPFGNEIKNDEALSKLILLPIKIKNQWGYMDLQGKLVIPPSYSEAGFFNEDIAAVVQNEKFGFISKANKFIVDPIYDEVTDFFEGRSIVEKNGKFGMIDRNGYTVFEPIFEELGPVSEGMVFARKDTLYGYYSRNRISLIPERYEEAESFELGYAHVRIQGKEAIIDSVGSFIVNPIYDNVEFYSDTLLIFIENEKYGICNLEGNPIVSARYDYIGKLVDNRAIIVDQGKIGYINESGIICIPASFEIYPNYQSYANFNLGLAKVKKNGKAGLIDLNGKTFVPYNYNEIGLVTDIMACMKNEKWGFIDKMGKEKIKMNYEYAESFRNGCGIITKDSLMGVIDITEKSIIQNVYSSISWLENTELLLVQSGGIYGIYNTNGEILIPVTYQSITKINNDFLLLKKGDQMDYYQLKERKLIQLKN